jgi:hypothetical protein
MPFTLLVIADGRRKDRSSHTFSGDRCHRVCGGIILAPAAAAARQGGAACHPGAAILREGAWFSICRLLPIKAVMASHARVQAAMVALHAEHRARQDATRHRGLCHVGAAGNRIPQCPKAQVLSCGAGARADGPGTARVTAVQWIPCQPGRCTYSCIP